MGKLTARGEAWTGDWRSRLATELHRLGFASLKRYAETNRHSTYTAIAEGLEGSFAPIQMMMAMRSEFIAREDTQGFVADCLWRYLTEYVRAPSAHAGIRETQAAEALGACGAAIGSANDAVLLSVWGALREKIRDGWLPREAADQVLRTAIDAAHWQPMER